MRISQHHRRFNKSKYLNFSFSLNKVTTYTFRHLIKIKKFKTIVISSFLRSFCSEMYFCTFFEYFLYVF